MSVTVQDLVAFAPEFAPAEDALISAKITEAEARCPVETWGEGEFRDRGVLHKAARLVALSPWGREMRLVLDGGGTVWDAEIKQLNRIAAGGLGRTAGEP